MTPTILGKEKKKRPTLDPVTTPIWDADRGRRLAIIRMMHFHDQRSLAQKLGVTQAVISRIEKGSIRVPEKPFSVEDLKAVYPTHVSFILLGTNEESVNANFYAQRYWREKLKRRGEKED